MKIEVIKKFNSQSNKTVFLRKLENVLIDRKLINKSDLKSFRNNSAIDVIALLNSFQNALEDASTFEIKFG
jgi:hypothetical protein